MNEASKTEKEFDTVKIFREVVEKIAKASQVMNFAKFKEHLNRRKLQLARYILPHTTPVPQIGGVTNNYRKFYV